MEAEGVRQMEELRELKRIETELKQQVMEKEFFDALKDYFCIAQFCLVREF